MAEGENFRLIAIGGGGSGKQTFPALYPTIEGALDAGHAIFDALKNAPHRRPHSIQVIDVWTRRVVARAEADRPRSQNCPTCGANEMGDPFASPPVGESLFDEEDE